MKKAMLIMSLAALLLITAAGLYAEKDLAVDGIYLSPNPMEKYTTITVVCNQPTTLGVFIETETGTVIRNLYCGPAGEQIQLTWNRMGDDGSYTPRGNYIVRVSWEGRYTSTKKTLILK